MSANDIKEIAGLLNIGIPIVVGVVILVFCITNIDNLLILLSQFQKFFSCCSQKARKGAIANSIRGRVMKSSASLRGLGDGIMAKDLKIDWVKEENAETFIKNNQVIIRMQQNSNPHKNFVTAVTSFVGQGLLPKAKRYIDQEILNMSKLSVCRTLIINGDSEALDYFDETVLSPTICSDSEAEETLKRLKVIDQNGMFVNILLNEYAKASSKIYPDTPDPLLIAESREFLTYLYRIALRNISDVEEFQFNREYFKVHIFLTANSRTYARSGLRPYLNNINKSLSSGTETIYVFGLGRKTEIAKEISETIKETDFRIASITPHHYRHKFQADGNTIRGACYEISVYKEYASK